MHNAEHSPDPAGLQKYISNHMKLTPEALGLAPDVVSDNIPNTPFAKELAERLPKLMREAVARRRKLDVELQGVEQEIMFIRRLADAGNIVVLPPADTEDH